MCVIRVCQERVLIEAYRKCLSALSQCHGGLPDGEQPISLGLAGHSVDTFRYQVSQDKVSIHLPVCRLLAGTHTHPHTHVIINHQFQSTFPPERDPVVPAGLHVLLSRTEVASRFPEQLPLVCLSVCLSVSLTY